MYRFTDVKGCLNQGKTDVKNLKSNQIGDPITVFYLPFWAKVHALSKQAERLIEANQKLSRKFGNNP